MRLKSLSPSEHDEQSVVVQWFNFTYPKLAHLLYANPNGAALCDIKDKKKRAVRMNYLKAEGFKNGVPDLCLPVPRGTFHGLYLEMKTLKGVTSKEQLEFIDGIAKQGYFAVVCRGSDEAMQTLRQYVALGEFIFNKEGN